MDEPGLAGALDPGDFGLWTGFSELDGGGSTIFGPHVDFTAAVFPEGDGVFSMILSVVSGSYTVDPVAYGFGDNALLTGPVGPVSNAAAVREPATLTLFGVGLAGAAIARRRRRCRHTR